MKKYLVILVVMLLSSILVACGTSPVTTTTPSSLAVTSATNPLATGSTTTAVTTKPTTTQPATTQAVQTGGTLVLIITGTNSNYGNTTLNIANTDKLAYSVLERLVKLDKDGNLQPCLAEKWTNSPDGKSTTFSLRKGAKFHDGTPFNAEAAKYNLELIRDSPVARYKDYTVDIIDDSSIKVNYPSFDWARLIKIFEIVFVSPTSFKANTGDWSAVHPVGTGPFKFVSYERNSLIKLTRFDDYWGGKPYLDGVNYRIMADATSALLALKAGEGHILEVTPPDVQDLQKSGFNVSTYPNITETFFPSGANENSPLAKVKVRQALSYALDRQAITNSVGSGMYKVTYQPFEPGSWAYGTNVVGHPYNPAKAKQLLTEGGYPNGFKTKLIITAPSDVATLIQNYWKAVGIDAETQVASRTVVQEMQSKGWEGIMESGVNVAKGMEPGSTLGVVGKLNYPVFVSVAKYPEIDAVYSKIGVELNETKRKALFDEIDRLLVDEYCSAIYVYTKMGVTALNTKVHSESGDIYNLPLSTTWLSK